MVSGDQLDAATALLSRCSATHSPCAQAQLKDLYATLYAYCADQPLGSGQAARPQGKKDAIKQAAGGLGRALRNAT